VWNQKLDYESVIFRCRSCFETGHLAKNCPKASQKNYARKNHHRSTWWEGAQREHYTVIKEEYSRENSKSQEVGQERNISQDKQGESRAQQQKSELDNPSSIKSYEDSNTTQNKSLFNSDADLLDQTSSLTNFKKTNIVDHEATARMSEEPEEMKEMQDKESWKNVEKKKKATTPISPRKTRIQRIKNLENYRSDRPIWSQWTLTTTIIINIKLLLKITQVVYVPLNYTPLRIFLGNKLMDGKNFCKF